MHLEDGINLQDRPSLPADQQPVTVLQFQNHAADPVGGLIGGGNPPTGGTIPEGSSTVREAVRAATGQPNTTHNCYGNGGEKCKPFWGDSENQKPISQPTLPAVIKQENAK